MQDSEKHLIEAAQQGCVAAFEKLILPFESKMVSLAAGLLTPPDEAEDIYQEAMLNAYQALPKFRMQSQFSTWLYRIVVNTALASQRGLKQRFMRFLNGQAELNSKADDDGFLSTPASEETPEKDIHNAQLSQAIKIALASLSDKERAAFVLCHQQEFKVTDAAEVMLCSEGAIKSYLFRAREKMRTQLQVFMR